MAHDLIALGYWKSEDEPHLPSPRSLQVPRAPEDRERLASYLESGEIFMTYLGCSWCRFDCGAPEHEMGSGDLTDGRWLWPSGLAHYVRRHEVSLPEEFLSHAKQLAWKVPAEIVLPTFRPTEDGAMLIPVSYDFWIQWGSA